MKKIMIAVIMFISLTGLSAQQLLTLEEAVSTALENNNYVQVAENNNEIRSNNFHIGNAGLLPRVDLSGAAIYNDNETNINGIKTSTQTTNNSANITLSYTLFDGLSRLYNYNKLETSAEIGELEARNQKESIAYTVIANYYNVARAVDRLEIANEALEISNERFQRTKKRIEFGQAGRIDYLNARVDFNTDSVNFINAQTNLEQARQFLNVILNRDINTQFSVEPDVQFDELPSLSVLEELAEANNAEKLIAENNVKLAEQDVNLSYSSLMPSLTLRSSYGYNGLYDDFSITFDDPNSSFSTSLNLSLNLFNGFSDDIKRQNSQIELNNSRLLSNQTGQELSNEILSVYQSYQDSRIILQMEINNLEAAELNFQRTKELYELGKVTNTEFREAQLKLIQARTNISASKYSAKIYETELKKLSGTLLVIK